MTFLFIHFTPLICRNRIYQLCRLSPLTDISTAATAPIGRFHWLSWCTVTELGRVCSSLCSGLCVLVMEDDINHKMALKAFIKHWSLFIELQWWALTEWFRSDSRGFSSHVLDSVWLGTSAQRWRDLHSIKTGLATWRCVFIWWCTCLG